MKVPVSWREDIAVPESCREGMMMSELKVCMLHILMGDIEIADMFKRMCLELVGSVSSKVILCF